MSQINETHPRPVRVASVGHQAVHLYGRHTGPRELATPPQPSRRQNRANAKAAVRAARREAASGAGWLRSLTTTTDPRA